MGMFHDSGKCLGTYNGLMPVGGSEIGGSTLGGCRFGEIVNVVQTALSLRSVEDIVSCVLTWAQTNICGLQVGPLIMAGADSSWTS